MMKLYNKNKKGTIILSHYRSGGTQLKLIISNILDAEGSTRDSDFGEIDFDLHSVISKKDFYSKLKSERYGVTLINNPIVISWINNNEDVFEYLKENFHIFGLKRKDKLKCLLSLGVWERFILAGLYESYDRWTDKNLKQFHEDTLNDLLKPKEVGIGYKSIAENSDNTHHSHLNQVVKIYLDELNVLETLCNKFKVDTINYEDYEHNKSFLVDYFPKTKRNATIIKDTYKGKIPYVTSDYLDYYEDSVREILKSWGMSND